MAWGNNLGYLFWFTRLLSWRCKPSGVRFFKSLWTTCPIMGTNQDGTRGIIILKNRFMSKIKRAYYYLFYKFYRFGSDSGPFSRNFSAIILMVILETSLVISLNCYYIEFFDRTGVLKLYTLKIILPLLIIFFLNYFTFVNTNQWKNYIQEFDKWPKYKNVIGSCITIILIALLLFSIKYSLSEMRLISGNRH